MKDSLVQHIDSLNKDLYDVVNQIVDRQQLIYNLIEHAENKRIITYMPNDLFWILIATLVGWGLGQMKNIYQMIEYYRRYRHYEGYYISRLKSDNSEHYFIQVKRRKNQFIIKGLSIKKDDHGKLEKRNEPIFGRIIMGNVLEDAGTGYYQHKPDSDGNIRAGDYKIQLSPPNKMIATQYISEDNNMLSTPRYIWEKCIVKDDQTDLKKQLEKEFE